ncbi:MAG TPA: hypothetical protein VL551_21675 [Actinospica sp.]|nr:hypothetical protein [Actinospica sp.]
MTLHWVFPGARVTLLVLLALATVATLAVGMSANKRSPARRGQVQRRAATVVIGWVYCGVVLLGACGVAVLYGINGHPSETPAASDYLPLPAGLTVAADMDDGCGGGATVVCLREIDVTGAKGQSQSDIFTALNAQAVARGWPSGVSCRNEGFLLDRHQECINIGLVRGQIGVQLEDESGW